MESEEAGHLERKTEEKESYLLNGYGPPICPFAFSPNLVSSFIYQ